MSHNHYQLNSIPYPAVIIDHSGIIMQVNHKAAAFASAQAKDLLNTSSHEAFHPAEVLEVDCPLCDYIKNQKGQAFQDIHYQDKNTWYRTSLSPVNVDNEEDGLLQMWVDISEPVSVKKKSTNNEMPMRTLLSKIPVIYYQIDQGGIIQEMVGAALSKLDLDLDKQAVVSASDVFHELVGKYDMIMRHGQYFFESQHSTSEGEAWFLHYIFRTPENNELTGFALDVTSMKRAQRKMLKLSLDKRSLARKMLQMQEDVRYEVARELHDEIGQSITAVRVIASAMLGAQNVAPDFYRKSAETISDVAEKMYDSAHELMYRLRPVALDTLGLESAIQSCVHASGLTQAGVGVDLEMSGELETMDQLVQLTLFRIVQESLTNIAKYAKASVVQIEVKRKKTFNQSICYSDLLELKISDDGIGFSENQKQNKQGMGILGLRERVQALGGILNISSHTGKGAVVFVRINLKAAEVDSA